MRILHVHKAFHERDGAGRYMLGLMRLQQADGHVVAPFVMRDERNLPSPWEKYFVSNLDTQRVGWGLGAFRQAGRALWSREAARKMARMIDAFHPDVIHVHNIYTHLSPSVLHVAHKRGIPVVMTVHDYALVSANYALWDGNAALDENALRLFRIAATRFIKGSFFATFALEAIFRLHRLTRAYDRVVSAYVVPSRYVRDVLVRYAYPLEKMVIQPPFTEAPTLTQRYDQGYVLFVGRLESYKGPATLIQAMRAFPETKVVLVGDGPERGVLQELAKGMRNVEFRGFLSGKELWEAYAGARVAVVPSIWPEPFGLVALEAMARSVPVIVSNAGGLKEIVEDGKSGLVFTAGDVKDLQRCLAGLVGNGRRAGEMGEFARVRAREVGNSVAYTLRINDVYRQVLDEDPACG